MAEHVHTTHVRVEKVKGPIRQAYIEHFAEPVRYGLHSAVKRFYGVESEEELPATLDHMVAAIAA